MLHMRIPLSDEEYVNFKYPAATSVRHAVAISSIGELLQRSLAARSPMSQRSTVREMPRREARAAEVVGS